MALMEYIKKVFSLSGDEGAREPGSSRSGMKGTEPDELLGRWHSEDDGSGLHYIWGSSLELNEDGTGIYSSWGDTDPDNSGDFPISWTRNGKQKIKIRFGAYADWEQIDYSISPHTGPYGNPQEKLTDTRDRTDSTHKEGFWIVGGGLFREK